VSPTLALSSDGLGSASAGGSNGIGGGGNTATDSIGVIQVGGGNSSDGSAGVVQAGSIAAAPTADATVVPIDASVAVGGSSGIGGSGNTATDSIGVAQLGGGNTSSSSIGTAQSRSVDVRPTASAGDSTLAPAVNVGGSGNGPGNSATDSIGAVQIGVANSADQSIGTAQVGPTTVGQASGGTGGGGTGGGGTGGGGTGGGGGGTGGGGGGGTGGGGGGTTGGGGGISGGGISLPAVISSPRGTPAGGRTTSPVAAPGTSPAMLGTLPAQPTRHRVPPARTGIERVTPSAAAPAKPSGGGLPVLSAKLPFTGISLWLAVLVAASLLAAGTVLRRTAAQQLTS
jgi:hypothetical protein